MLGKRLKQLRKEKEFTQEKLADLLSVHPQTVSKWERDIAEPDIAYWGEIASAFNISLDELLCVETQTSYNGEFDASKMGKAIATLRQDSGLSQIKFAENLGFSADTVSKWERGVVCPSQEALCEIAKQLECAPSQIYYGILPQKFSKKSNLIKQDGVKHKGTIFWQQVLTVAICSIIFFAQGGYG